jgi:hypothetical protein
VSGATLIASYPINALVHSTADGWAFQQPPSCDDTYTGGTNQRWPGSTGQRRDSTPNHIRETLLLDQQ